MYYYREFFGLYRVGVESVMLINSVRIDRSPKYIAVERYIEVVHIYTALIIVIGFYI